MAMAHFTHAPEAQKSTEFMKSAAANRQVQVTLERWLDSNHSQEKWSGKKGIVLATQIHLEFLFSSSSGMIGILE
jgi:hypothetical protein